jgi:hypothetical protein
MSCRAIHFSDFTSNTEQLYATAHRLAELRNAGLGKWPKYCSSEGRRPHPKGDHRVSCSSFPAVARISHHLIAFLCSILLLLSLFFSGTIATLSQSSRKVPEPLHLRSPVTNVNIKLFIFHGIFTITITTTAHSPARSFLWLRRRTITPITQLKWQNMARA